MDSPRRIFQLRKEPIDYTMDQKKALLLIETFIKSNDLFFMIIGNAGTGKTTIAENIANYTNAFMIAPTNAAVKRLREKFGYVGSDRFFTIHQTLYDFPDPNTGEFNRSKGLARNKTYIVDESSMIDCNVLDDLIKSAQQRNCKLIFIGDDFQLEPVGKDPKIFSWEKSNPNFQEHWKIKLEEVKRNDGTILKIATHLRQCKYPEIFNINNEEFTIVADFTKELANDILTNGEYIVLVSNNKDRVKYNNRIRKFRFKQEASIPIISGEKLISVANVSYANGEIFEAYHPSIVQTFEETINIGSMKEPTYKTYTMYLIEYFASPDSNHQKKTFLIPDLDLPSLHASQLMTNTQLKFNSKITEVNKYSKKRQWLDHISISTYGYATSVHKSQGNEWTHVYIDCGWLSNNWNKCRWLYTAITRAKKKIEIIKSSQFKLIKDA